jgi:hypothetical protein
MTKFAAPHLPNIFKLAIRKYLILAEVREDFLGAPDLSRHHNVNDISPRSLSASTHS